MCLTVLCKNFAASKEAPQMIFADSAREFTQVGTRQAFVQVLSYMFNSLDALKQCKAEQYFSAVQVVKF